ncbi:MAG: tRNA pseudouridine(38-40) synthase TruA [Bacteroidales bacterium]|nr:MAG: tRNA pseudouridine(38-40) synthase TruA [Bacteroidales bacterium]
MKQRYFIRISFKGTNFHGWQIQPRAVTVQGTLNKVLSTVLREKIETTGAGRTDTGVHAKFFVAHFDSNNKQLDNDSSIIYSLNSLLSPDISVNKIIKVSGDDHARFSAISRTYEYHISRIENPFEKEFSWYIYGALDIEKMNEAARLLENINDFTSFSKEHSNVKTNICNISFARWDDYGDKLIFTIKADRFLRNMVRAIVGTMIKIGRNKIMISEFKKSVEKKTKKGFTAPAQGLILTDIEYHVNIN